MMSYLWILILGSLLASQTMAQDADPDAGGAEVSDAEEEAPVIPETSEGQTEETVANPDPTEVSTELPTEPDQTEPGTEATEEETAEPETTPAVEPAAEDPAEAVEPTTSTETDPEIITEVTTKEKETEVVTSPGTPAVFESTTIPADPEEATTDPGDEGSTTTSDSELAVTEEPTTAKTSVATDAPPAVVEAEPNGETTVAANVNVDVDKDTATSASPMKGFIEETLQAHFNQGVKSGRGAGPAIREEEPQSGAANSGTQAQGGSGILAGVLSGIILSAVGAVSGYFAYQKKKLCFKNREGEADPEAGRKADAAEAKSDPQALNTLLNSNSS